MAFVAEHYMWFKAFHIIMVISWMAGLFYLPRLFVYHTQAEVGSQQSETFKTMEYKLLKIIMNPAMIGTFLFGLLLIGVPGAIDWSSGWMHLKLVLVVLMAGFHMYLARCRRNFENDQNEKPEKFFRIINEIPTLLMMVIVILAVVKAILINGL